MLLTSARVVPHIARARLLSLFGAIVTAPAAIVAVTSVLIGRANLPLPPLTVSTWSARLTWTPAGIATGFLPMRDMILNSLASEYPTEDLAADLGDAGLAVRHDATRCRQDRDAEPVIDPRQVDELGINPPSRFRDTRNLAD